VLQSCILRNKRLPAGLKRELAGNLTLAEAPAHIRAQCLPEHPPGFSEAHVVLL
jgi:hypothetical protein